MNRTIEDIQKDIELLGIKGGYDIEELLTPQDCRRLSYEIERLKGVYEKNLELVDKMYVKDKEIERLNNIINEFESWLISWIENEQYCFMSNNPEDRCRRKIYEEVLHHFKELKGSDKE